MKLYHFSEEPDISVFYPRSAYEQYKIDKSWVWAIDEATMFKYYVPRDCPRVAGWAIAESKQEDIDTLLLGDSGKILFGIEKGWLNACLNSTLYRYEFDGEHFYPREGSKGVYVSEHKQVPLKCVKIENLLESLLDLGNIELRILPDLWDLRETIFTSSLDFSFIRMRNARPPHNEEKDYLPL